MAACMNCHELKDRTPFLDWPVSMYGEGVQEIMRAMNPDSMAPLEWMVFLEENTDDCLKHWYTWSTIGRLVFAKMVSTSHRAKRLKHKREERETLT